MALGKTLNAITQWWNSKGVSTIPPSPRRQARSRNASSSSLGSSGIDDGEHMNEALKEMLFGTKLNILLLLAVPWIAGQLFHWPDGLLFWLSLGLLIPLAERLAYVTDQLALHTTPTMGGLLNATFGNATELIVCMFALSDGLTRVVQLSLLGSVLSNLLLVLGASFLVGGLKYKTQQFKEAIGHANAGLLTLSALAITLPTMMKASGADSDRSDDLRSSRLVSVILLINYVLYLVFQLKTHSYLFEEDAKPTASTHSTVSAVRQQLLASASATTITIVDDGTNGDLGGGGATNSNGSSRDSPVTVSGSGGGISGSEDDDEEERDVLGLRGSLVCLGVITILVSFVSGVLVRAIKGAADQYGISSVFICAILIPIAGNAAEHAAAVIFAYKNKMEIVMGIALGSSTQISLFVLPLCVVLGWMMDTPMSLYFTPFETVTLLISIIMVTFMLVGANGKSNWLIGIILISTYLVVASAFWDHKDEDLESAPARFDNARNGAAAAISSTPSTVITGGAGAGGKTVLSNH